LRRQHAAEVDIINSHMYCYALPFARLVSTPTVFDDSPTPDAGSGKFWPLPSGNSDRSRQALRSRSTRATRPPRVSPGRGRS